MVEGDGTEASKFEFRTILDVIIEVLLTTLSTAKSDRVLGHTASREKPCGANPELSPGLGHRTG